MVRKIVVLNPKGGSGKTTIATNLAAFFASRGICTALMDFDSQESSTRWLSKRPKETPCIHGVAMFSTPVGVTRSFALRLPPDVERIVVDTSAALGKHELLDLTRGADKILIPVLPSDIDIYAATRLIADLLLEAKVRPADNRMAVVANRVKQNTIVFGALMRFLNSLDIPVASVLRDSQNYIRSAANGIGIHELTPSKASKDVEQWATLTAWLDNDETFYGKLAEEPTPFASSQ